MKERLLRRFIRGTAASLIAVFIPTLVSAVESQEFANLLGPGLAAVAVGALLGIDKAVRDRYGSWLNFLRQI